ncbi:FadR/GntR family transcriptional regulator [Rhodoligotrophos ferricapiens]|uniref:FadR/GntR family transcriptional regulator n=1 Tax=Rhodoligotrophos ferricapiens TaxID=3069264 RepID=UPI00315C98CC
MNPSRAQYGQIVTRSAASQIADRLEQEILEGRLKVDDRLPTEEELAAQFGVSRPTVREALKRLAARHLIRSRRGPSGGNFVTGPSPDDLAQSLGTAFALLMATDRVSLDEMAVARLELEAICCRRAAQLRTEEHLAGLRAELEIQRQSNLTDQDFCESELRFHRIIVEACDNALLRFMMNAMVETLMPISNMIIFRLRDRKAIVEFHERMAEGLAHRDAEAAIAALSDLIAYIHALYARAQQARAAQLARGE